MSTWKSWKIYKDEQTILEKQQLSKILEPFPRINGSVKEYRKAEGFSGLVINYGSEKIACPIGNKELAEQMKVPRCWDCHEKNQKCLKKCSIWEKEHKPVTCFICGGVKDEDGHCENGCDIED